MIVPRNDSLRLAHRFADPLIIEHPGGHIVPGHGADGPGIHPGRHGGNHLVPRARADACHSHTRLELVDHQH